MDITAKCREDLSVEEMRNYIFLYFNKQFDLKSNGYNKY